MKGLSRFVSKHFGEEDRKSDIYVKMTMTSPACPAGPQLVQESKDVLADLGEQVGKVTVEVVLDPPGSTAA